MSRTYYSAIGNGTRSCPELLGSIQIERSLSQQIIFLLLRTTTSYVHVCVCMYVNRVRKEDAYGQVLAGRLSNQERSELIKKLMQRAHVTKPDIAARLLCSFAISLIIILIC